jgi:hypothetical protein
MKLWRWPRRWSLQRYRQLWRLMLVLVLLLTLVVLLMIEMRHVNDTIVLTRHCATSSRTFDSPSRSQQIFACTHESLQTGGVCFNKTNRNQSELASGAERARVASFARSCRLTNTTRERYNFSSSFGSKQRKKPFFRNRGHSEHVFARGEQETAACVGKVYVRSSIDTTTDAGLDQTSACFAHALGQNRSTSRSQANEGKHSLHAHFDSVSYKRNYITNVAVVL